MRAFGNGAFALALVTAVNAQDNKVSSRLQVNIPHALFRPDGYDHREALFGIPPYGGSITQFVYYADSDLCDPNVNTRGGFPLRGKNESGDMIPWPSPYILMVDRGGCTFVTKVRNAQRSGAAGVIIADNTCLCAAGDSCFNDNDECEEQEPIMADDGSGNDISIPSFLMFKQDADPMKQALVHDTMMQLSMSWSLPTPDDRVEYSLWTTPTEAVSREFELQFKHAATALGKHAQFTPHMYIYDGVKSNCQDENNENQCYNLCTNNGRYCATDPDNDLDKGISGADVIVESLRRICIWEIYGLDGIGSQWWDYVNEFAYRCASSGFFTDAQCIKDALNHANADSKKILSCMKDSGGTSGDKVNILLEKELIFKDKAGVVVLPQAYVNDVSIRGALEFQTVFRAVCAGYSSGTTPSVCKTCILCPDQLTCTERQSCSSVDRANDSVSSSTFAVSLLGVSAFFGVLGLIQYKRSKDQVRNQVRGIIAEYMPLDEERDISTSIEEDHEIS